MPLSTEYVTINSVVLSLDGAWELRDPTPLLGEGPPRGSNLAVSGTAGRTHRDKEVDEFRVPTLQMDVWGDKDELGVAHADVRSGLRDNLEYLRTNLLTWNTGGAVTLTYTFPDAATRSGSVEVVGLRPRTLSQAGNWTIVDLDIVILGGALPTS